MLLSTLTYVLQHDVTPPVLYDDAKTDRNPGTLARSSQHLFHAQRAADS
jgi:hypothetical protein